MSCDRFEREFLFAMERGQPLDPHVQSCGDCAAARGRYESLIGTIADANVDAEPNPDWEARVWARIAKAQPRKPNRWRWPALALSVATALAVILLVWLRRPDGPKLLVSIEAQNNQVLRSTATAHPGDRLVLTVNAGGARFAEVRVYRNDNELVMKRSIESGRGDFRVELLIPSVGRYRALLLRSPNALPEATSSLDKDSSRAMGVGATVELSLPVEVW